MELTKDRPRKPFVYSNANPHVLLVTFRDDRYCVIPHECRPAMRRTAPVRAAVIGASAIKCW